MARNQPMPQSNLLSRWMADCSGTSAIEFAIVATLLFALVFGLIIYGSYFASLSLVNHIAFEAARASLAGLTDAERTTLAEQRANELAEQFSGLLTPEDLEVEAGPAGDGLFAVTIRHEFTAFGLEDVAALVPLPPSMQTATIEVSHGGY